MKDVLQDLVNDIQKSRSKPTIVKRVTQRPSVRTPTQITGQGFVKARGPGGILFDFGRSTGNPHADIPSALLQKFADPTQLQIAEDQAAEIDKAFVDYVNLGQEEYEKRVGIADATVGQLHQAWNKQLSKSFDQQTAEYVKAYGLKDEGDGKFVKGDFNKSQVRVGKEDAVAQSETDAAVVEMMKNGLLTVDEGN